MEIRFSILAKLLIVSTTIVLVVATALAGANLFGVQSHFREYTDRLMKLELDSLKSRALVAAASLADSAVKPLFEQDPDTVQQAIDKTRENEPEFEFIMVIRPDGRVVARTGRYEKSKLEGGAVTDQLGVIKKPTVTPVLFGIQDVIAVAAPVDAAGRREGTLYLEISKKRVADAVSKLEQQRKKAFKAEILKSLGVTAIAVLFGVILSVLQSLRFTRPLTNLARVANAIGKGDLEARAEPTTRDEIGLLATRFNQMADQLVVLLDEASAKASYEREIDLAQTIQRSLIPPPKTHVQSELIYRGLVDSAQQCGGDWWHDYLLEDGRILICVGDVTGHGVPSAMLTASAKACCDTVLPGKSDLALAELMTSLDHVIREAGRGEYVMTFFAVIFDLATHTVEYCNAGHNFPFLVRDGKTQSLVARGGRLGDGTEFHSQKREVHSGDSLVLYTDGILECTNAQGVEYGVRRFKKSIKKHGQLKDAQQIHDGIVNEAYSFFGSTPRVDDITLVTVVIP